MQAVVYFRASGAVADSHFIVGIDDVVAIHVAILYITVLHRREILCGTCSDVCFILEETDSFQTIHLSDTITFHIQVIVFLIFLIYIDYF